MQIPHPLHHALGALGIVQRQPFIEQRSHFPRQTQHCIKSLSCTGLAGCGQHLLHIVVQERNLRRQADAYGYACLAQGPNHAQPSMRRSGAWFQLPGQLGLQGGQRHINGHQMLLCQRHQQIKVALDAAALGDDGKRMPGLCQNLYHAARQPDFALHRLVAVRDRAEHDGGRHMAGPG